MTLGYLYSRFFKHIVRGKSVLGSDVDSTSTIGSGTTFYHSSIGKCSYVGCDCEVVNTDIGKFCSLSSGIHIGLAEHPMDWVSTSPAFQDVKHSSVKKRFARLPLPECKRTIIDHDVWIGTNAFIKAGVHIGTGAVIAAGAVVTKDVEPYSVVGGVPARLLKYRFDGALRERLLSIKWWELSDERLARLGYLVETPVKFIDAIGTDSE